MFKKLALAAVLAVSLSGCGDPAVIDGKYISTYGIAGDPVPCIKYRVVVGNVIWGIVLSETVIAPIYFAGWSLYEPIGKIEPCSG